MWDPYYSWQPSIVLEQHIFLVGFYGTPMAKIARFMTATTGISLFDLERQIEHQLGTRLYSWLQSNSVAELQHLEQQLLQSALEANPKTVILLMSNTLKNPLCQNLWHHHKGIWIEQPLEIAWQNIQAQWKELNTDRLLGHEIYGLDHLRIQYKQWKEHLPSTWRHFPVLNNNASVIADQIREYLK